MLAAVAVGWLVIKWLLKRPGADETDNAPTGHPEKMVKCDLCGVFMPESDSAQRSEEHTSESSHQ